MGCQKLLRNYFDCPTCRTLRRLLMQFPLLFIYFLFIYSYYSAIINIFFSIISKLLGVMEFLYCPIMGKVLRAFIFQLFGRFYMAYLYADTGDWFNGIGRGGRVDFAGVERWNGEVDSLPPIFFRIFWQFWKLPPYLHNYTG